MHYSGCQGCQHIAFGDIPRAGSAQVDLVERGRKEDIVQETRLYDEGKQTTYPMRTKEGLADYRYFPEPDLPAVNISADFLQQVKVNAPASLIDF